MSDQKDNSVNLFKPRTPHGKANSKMVISMIIVWAVAIFGFQTLLIILNKPTPEKNYIIFEQVWPEISEDRASTDVKKKFSRVVLSVLGKSIVLKADHKDVLKNTLSTLVYSLVPDKDKKILQNDFNNRIDIAVKKAISALDLKPEGFEQLMIELLPPSLTTVDTGKLQKQQIDAMPGIMKLYLVHNQNVLTDIRFLGFPFHYFYVSQLLLILFVLLCYVYCKVTDRIHEKYGFIEEKE